MLCSIESHWCLEVAREGVAPTAERRKPPRQRMRAIAAACAVGVASAAVADTLYVDDDAGPGGDGSSWGAAYEFLQDALDHAAIPDSGIDTIKIAQGVYTPDRNMDFPDGTRDRSGSFVLSDGLHLIGGYAGISQSSPDQRDPSVFITTLSGDLNGDDGAGFANHEENAWHVVLIEELEGEIVLDGLFISGGEADESSIPSPGGFGVPLGSGIICHSTDLTLINCVVHHNRAQVGSGAYLWNGNFTVDRCTFRNNWATEFGAAIRARLNSTLTIQDSLFQSNYSVVFGSVACAANVDVHLGYSRFAGNQGLAGAVFADEECRFSAEHCQFVNNGNEFAIGAVTAGSDTELTSFHNCEFVENYAPLTASALAITGETDLVNCIFSRNDSQGECIFSEGPVNAVNCTFVDNGGAIIRYFDGAIVRNCVSWGNDINAPEEQGDNNDNGKLAVEYSCIQGGWPGEGNTDVDPLIAQPSTDNLRLLEGSPCVGAGNSKHLPSDSLDLDNDGDIFETVPIDLDGHSRLTNGSLSMGAYELPINPLPPAESTNSLDNGDLLALVPNGGEFDPANVPAIVIQNLTGEDSASAQITQLMSPSSATGTGSDVLSILAETSLQPGEYNMVVFVPIASLELDGDPWHIADATWFNEDTERWNLAVASNTQNSEGWDSPIGTRDATEGGSFHINLGDYGVVWFTEEDRGYVWANVDHPGLFSWRALNCSADPSPDGGDGYVEVSDLLDVLRHWGTDDRFADIDENAVVDGLDLAHILSQWGMCE